MELSEIEKKQQQCIELSVDIARISKILSIKQNQFNKLDTEIYNYYKEHPQDKNNETKK